MKRVFLFVLVFFSLLALIQANERINFKIYRDTAQYKGSDYANVVQVERGIPLEQAWEIAKSNPEIDYFVYTKGALMVLEVPPELQFDLIDDPFHLLSYCAYRCDSGAINHGFGRLFQRGDTVFFRKEGMWLARAPGLADTYLKVDTAFSPQILSR